MNNNDLIPIEREQDIKRKGKRKTFFLTKIICYTLILLLGYYAYINFDSIKSFISEHKAPLQNEQEENNSSTDTDNTQSNDKENNENDTHENAATIPKDAYKINGATGSFIEINNESSLSVDADFSSTSIPPASETYAKYGKDAPHILIIHSSCNESYSNGKYYYTNDSFYSTKDNVADVGKIICDALNENHINAIHIDDIFGGGGIYNSKKQFENATNEALKKYPSIKIVLDISRGININDDLSMDKLTTKINGKDASQISLTVGSDIEKGIIYNKNLNFANALYNENKDLIYDITIAPFKLSQDIEPLFLKVDVGSYSNTFEEAALSGYAFAQIICSALS